MLKKTAKIAGICGLTLISIVLAVLAYSFIDIQLRVKKTYSVSPQAITVSHDSASILKGARLVETRACTTCHGADLGGHAIADDPLIGTLVSKNITRGIGGLPDDFTEEDWVMAMKHGLNRDGKPLYLMPSHELSQLSESDVSAIIAYCSQIPKVDRKPAPFKLGPLGYILSEFKLIPLLPAEFTDHARSFEKEIMPGLSVEYGKYLSTICINCHGGNMKGGESPVPGGKPVADITSTGNPGKWTHAQFISTLKTGKTPEGKLLNPEEMPWTITKSFTEEELTALHLYLQTLK